MEFPIFRKPELVWHKEVFFQIYDSYYCPLIIFYYFSHRQFVCSYLHFLFKNRILVVIINAETLFQYTSFINITMKKKLPSPSYFLLSFCNSRNKQQLFKPMLLIFAISLLFHKQNSAQNLSINTTGALPDSSAMLDIVSANKGLLIPRVSLTGINDNITITNPAISLLVYNTNSSMTGGGLGFWYWNGTQWTRFSGTFGTTGNTGATGPAGADGINGINGATGSIGSTGNTGVKGDTGPTGSTGSIGATGAPGADGTNGINGATGSIGATGSTGADGIDGSNGATGSIGATGQAGTNGADGIMGATGATGADGAKNAWGLTGNSGTVDATSFIGTVDNVPFNIRVNNQQSGKIDPLLLNTFWGYQSGKANSSGIRNTGNGYQSLSANTTGTNNTANGYLALNTNTTGQDNTANGQEALKANTTGSYNTAIGSYALNANTIGERNTACGMYALISNTTGSYNTANGKDALLSNTSGIRNTAFGHGALANTATGINNTASGYQAGAANTTGSNNTYIGYGANSPGQPNLSNATAIGANTSVTASNSLVLGNAANVGIGTTAPAYKLDITGSFNVNGPTTCTSGAWLSSDQLFKTAIDSIANALAIIYQLKPRSFNFDTANVYGLNFNDQKQYGLIAQEVEQVLPELVSTTTKTAVYDTAGVLVTPAITYKILNYTAFSAILMKGIQEQQQKINSLSTKADSQEAIINSLQNQINTLSNQIQQLQH